MIRVHFVSDEQGLIGQVSLRGHADLNPGGVDPLCAAVTGMVTMVANTLTEVLHLACEIRAEEDGEFFLSVPQSGRREAATVLSGFKVQLQDYQAQFPENICVTVED